VTPYPGVTVAWSATSGGATVPAQVTTGMDGVALVTPTLGTAAGEATFVGTALVPDADTAGLGLTDLHVSATGAADAPARLIPLSGDGQVGVGTQPLASPLVVKLTDAYGNPISGHTLAWSVIDGGGALAGAQPQTGSDGTGSAHVVLGASALSHHFEVGVPGTAIPSVIFSCGRNPYRLAYEDPGPGGKLRLVRNAASTDSSVVLDVVVGGAPLDGFATGLDLPLDTSRVALSRTEPLQLPQKPALNPGTQTPAMHVALPAHGPFAGTLVTAVSQKAAGAGATATDAKLTAGAVLYSVKLDLAPLGTPGVVFDGTAKAFSLPSGGLRNKIGATVVGPRDVAIGTLSVVD
jgi:hypothetical protein